MPRPRVFLLCACAWAAHAQPPAYDVHPDYLARRFTVEDGLPSNLVDDVVVQPGGYLWLATADGLARFDGAAFTVYDAATAALRSSRITRVYVDPADSTAAGAVWFRAGEADLYRFEAGTFESMRAGHGLTGASPNVTAFDADGTWVVSFGGVWTWAGGALRQRWAGVLDDGEVYSLYRAGDGSRWVLQPHAVFHVAGGRVRRYPIPSGWTFAYSLLDPAGTLWLSTSRGVARLQDGRFSVVAPVEDPVWMAATADGRRWVARAFERTWSRLDADGLTPVLGARLGRGALSTTVASGPDGAAWLVQDGWLIRETTPILRLASPTSVPVPLAVDAEGTVWVGGGAGLVLVRRRTVSVVSAEEGLGGRNVYPVLAARDGSVWAGLWYEGHHLAQIVDGRPAETHMLPGAQAVTSLLEDRRGRLWIGTDDGVFWMEGGRPVRALSVSAACGVSRYVNALVEDRDGRIWAGAENWLIRGERTAGGWRWTCAPLDGVSIQALVATRRGEILAASVGRGLGRMTSAGRFEWLGVAEGLASDNVREVHEDERGVLWIATEDRGLCRLDRGGQPSLRAGTLGCLSEADGLLDNSLHRVIPDGDGRLWLNSNAGIFALSRADADAVAAGAARALTVQAFTEADGLRNREGNGGRQPAGSRAPDGRLWFPTQDGVASVDPAAVGRPSPPPARIEGVHVAGRAVPEATWRAGPLVMGPRERDLRVAYTGIALGSPEAVRFRVRLSGYSAVWREVGASRSEAFTNLPAGRYTVEVQASRGGAWSAPARLAVVRRPLVWETAWFRALAVLAVAGAAALGVRQRLRGLALRQRELEQTVEARTADLRRANEVKSRFLANVSHELRTPLALLLGPVRDLRDGRFGVDDRARPLLDRAATNGRRLQGLIDDLLTLSRLDADVLALQRQRLDLVVFTRIRASAFDSTTDAAEIALTLEAPEGPVWIAADPAKLETVLYNLIGNAVKFTPGGGRVTVRVAPDGDGARVEVEDTGVGIDAADLPHLFDRFFQADTAASRVGEGAGIGLALSRELVELHGGTIEAASAPGVGTTVTVRLPAGTVDVEGTADLDAASPPPAPPRHHAPDARRSGPDDAGPLVLVVEDNADLRAYIVALLGDRYHVEEAPDGAEGVARAVDLVPDLVVSDVMMPGLDGFALLAALKGDVRTSHVPVVLLTARADVESRVAGLGAGADGYLAKPFESAELEACVASLIANRTRLRAAWAGSHAPAAGRPEPEEDAGLEPGEVAFLGRLDGLVRAHLRTAEFGAGPLAEGLGLSPRQLRRKLVALTGEAPADYVRRVRLDRAAELLAEGTRSVKEVAWEVGFGSPSGFRTAFREAYGVAPAQYQRS